MQTSIVFDGPSLKSSDNIRLGSQLCAVRDVMSTGFWYSLSDLVAIANARFAMKASEAGVSARIRDLRKAKFGGHTIERRRRGNGGLWEYRLVNQ